MAMKNLRAGARVALALAAAAGPLPLARGAAAGHAITPELPFPRGLHEAALQRAAVVRAEDAHAPADAANGEGTRGAAHRTAPLRSSRPPARGRERSASPSAAHDGARAEPRANPAPGKAIRVRRGELCWFSTALLGDSWRSLQPDAEGERTGGLPSLIRPSGHVLRGGSGSPGHGAGRSGWGGAPLTDRGLPAWSRRADDSRSRRPDRRGYFMSAVSAAGGFVVGAAKALAVPYAAFLVLLYTAQRSIIFQSPQTVADPTATGGTLVRLCACNALLQTAASTSAREKGKEKLRESIEVYRQEKKGVLRKGLSVARCVCVCVCL